MDDYPSVCSAGGIRTFLIADVRDYTRFTLEHGDEAASRLAAAFGRICREVMSRHGTIDLKLRADDALAVFPSAREAILGALELQERCGQERTAHPNVPLNIGIGLDAGEAVSMEDDYHGTALNLAARLCSIAGPGEVLVTETVMNLARKFTGAEYAEKGKYDLKGFAEPVRVFGIVRPSGGEVGATAGEPATVSPPPSQDLPIGAFLGSLPRNTLVGREEELQTLVQIVESSRAGRGRTILLAGEPGAGKTRLAQEVTVYLRNAGFIIAAGRCYEAESAVPYYPFLDVFASIWARTPASIRKEAADRWPYLGPLLPAEVQSPHRSASEEDDQQRVFRAAASFLAAATDGAPLAIMLDDLHWADSGTIRLLFHLAHNDREHPILLLGAYRDVEAGRYPALSAVLRDLRKEELLTVIEVRRMNGEATGALVASLVGSEGLSSDFTGFIFRRTDGNPYFVEQVVRLLADRGYVPGHGAPDFDEIGVPDSIRAVVQQRTERLAVATQDVLREASVLGQTFLFEDLLAMAERPEQYLEAALEEASDAGLLRTDDGDTYAFDHGLTQSAIYADIAPRTLRRLHRSAGLAMERKWTDTGSLRDGRIAAELARHFTRASDIGRALTYNLLAGEAAERAFAAAEAEQQFRTALALARASNDFIALAHSLHALGRTLRVQAQYERALEALTEAADLYDRADEREHERLVAVQIAKVHAERGDFETGIRHLRSVLDTADESRVVPSLGAGYNTLAQLLFLGSRYRESLDAAERALGFARQLNDPQALAEATARQGSALSLLQQGKSVPVLEEAIRLSEAADDLVSLRVAVNNLSALHFTQGEFERSRALNLRALELAERIGNPTQVAVSLVAVGEVEFALGNWPEANRLCERALGISRAIASTTSIHPLLSLAQICLREGRWDEMDRYLDECLTLAERSGDVNAYWGAESLWAERDLLSGNLRGAQQRLRALVDRIRAAHLDPTNLQPMVAWVALEQGLVDEAEELTQAAFEAAEASQDRLTLLATLRIGGMVAARRERWDEADLRLAEALALAEMMSLPYERARALYEIGRTQTRRGDDAAARQSLTEAIAIFEQLGAAMDAASGREALGVLV